MNHGTESRKGSRNKSSLALPLHGQTLDPDRAASDPQSGCHITAEGTLELIRQTPGPLSAPDQLMKLLLWKTVGIPLPLSSCFLVVEVVKVAHLAPPSFLSSTEK